MRLLLDTHVFLWWITDSKKLSQKARRLLAAADNQCFLSIVSCWELALKLSRGKLRLTLPVERLVSQELAANGFELLGLGLRDVAVVEKLPFHHGDPFDRLLVAQAMNEGLRLVSQDRAMALYEIDVVQ